MIKGHCLHLIESGVWTYAEYDEIFWPTSQSRKDYESAADKSIPVCGPCPFGRMNGDGSCFRKAKNEREGIWDMSTPEDRGFRVYANE